ncbi:replication-relaxation family protein [Streptomyces chartreusis]|uniref:Replication-relaxation family protein n=1 Tax=Streptomyces chartreusis TaxID=1969 RepID=A0A7H8TH65_STRCX|nr:replication-relaxation family protein [Streptomyces chartreusis]QKZ22856.1 replication-relaxation family protein [Streptomyces chartreusis]
MKINDIASLIESLSERDLSILESLRTHRALTTVLIRRLHFPIGGEPREAGNGKVHATEMAAAVATIRVLTRLESHRLITRLHRRIGGVRAGSSGIVWQLGASGERLLRARHGDPARRRYSEPSPGFIAHTLAAADLAIRLYELARRSEIELLRLEAEPECWRTFLSPHGARQWLKPDLFAVTATREYEHHLFIEADNATEHAPVIVRKALQYERYANSGIHQQEHGLFPSVVWVVPDQKRQTAIRAALAAEPRLQNLAAVGVFHVVTAEDFPHLIAEGPENMPTP